MNAREDRTYDPRHAREVCTGNPVNAREILDAGMSERHLQDEVIRTAKRFGWERIYHTWRSDHSERGFPDLVMLRGDRQLVVELKREGEEPTSDQLAWLEAFAAAGAETFTWWPHNLSSGEIDRVLSGQD